MIWFIMIVDISKTCLGVVSDDHFTFYAEWPRDLAPLPVAVVKESLAGEHAHAQPEAEAGREMEAGALRNIFI